jgi:hypothetical protein
MIHGRAGSLGYADEPQAAPGMICRSILKRIYA